MKYGYVRCYSNESQRREQVNSLLEQVDVEEVFTEEGNGFQFSKYNEMCEILGVGDEVYILELDVLGNTIQEIWERWCDLYEDKRVRVHVLNFQNETSDMSLSELLNYFAKRERRKWGERQKAGIERARSGGKIGRPSIQKPNDFDDVYERVKKGKLTVKQAISLLGISQSTYYKFVSEAETPELPFI